VKKLLGSLMLFLTLSLYGLSDEAKSLLDDKDSYPTTAFDLDSMLVYINGFLSLFLGLIAAKFDLIKYLKKIKDLKLKR